MRRELKDKETIILDPLSHGNQMSCLRIEVEVLDVQSSPQLHEDVEVEDLGVAAYRVLSQQEVDYYDNSVPVDYGNWGDSMVGQVHTIVSINDGPWHHTHWSNEVEFD